MTDPKQADRREQARALYAEGTAVPVIARAVGVSAGTVRRWKRRDAEGDCPWRSEVEAAAGRPCACAGGGHDAGRLRRMLEEHLSALAERSAANPDKPGAEDRMLKVCRVLEFLRNADDVESQLQAMKRFAAFCVRTLPEGEMAPVREAIHLFLEHLRRENA